MTFRFAHAATLGLPNPHIGCSYRLCFTGSGAVTRYLGTDGCCSNMRIAST